MGSGASAANAVIATSSHGDIQQFVSDAPTEIRAKLVKPAEDLVSLQAQIKVELRPEFVGMKVSALKKEATAVGVSEADVDWALDHDDTREAFIQLILKAKAATMVSSTPDNGLVSTSNNATMPEPNEVELANDLAAEDSKLLGVSLDWVLANFFDVAWEKIEEKQCFLRGSKPWPGDTHEETLACACRREDGVVKHRCVDRWKGTTRDDVKIMNFFDLKEIMACTSTGIGYRKTCPRDRSTNGCSIVDALYAKKHSKRATIFMSWVWSYKAKDALSGLHNWLSKAQHGRQQHQFVWWCFFCNNQYALNKVQATSDSLAETFGKKLAEVGTMLINLDKLDEPIYVKRAWCIFENWVAVEKHIPVQATLSNDGVTDFQLHVAKGTVDLESYVTVHSKTAEATMPEDTAYIQNQMKGRHEDVDKIVGAALLKLVKTLSQQWAPLPTSVLDRMGLMVEKLESAMRAAEPAEAKDLILVVGNTGSGKSTLLNYLSGCQMFHQREGGKLQIYVDRSEEVTPIGHTNMSETASPILVEIGGQCFCDCPGFEDRSGADISITNTINVMHFVRKAKSVRFLVLLSYASISTDRGIGVDQLFHMLHDMFGDAMQLAQHSHAILLCVTKAPRKFDDDGAEVTIDSIVSEFKSLRELLNQYHDPDLSQAIHTICHQCVVYHPLGGAHSSWVQDREELLEKVKGLGAIQSGGEQCLVAPNDHEINTLLRMLRAFDQEFEEVLNESMDKAKEVLKTMEALNNMLFTTGMRRHQRMLDLHTEFKQAMNAAKEKLTNFVANAQKAAALKKAGEEVLGQGFEAKTKIFLFSRGIDDEKAQAIAAALPNCRSLQRLDLGMNTIGNEGAKAIAAALPGCGSLQLLELNENKIGDEGAKAIAAALPNCTSLKELRLNYNQIGNDGAKAIAAALPNCGSLQELNLGSNQIGVEGAKAIAAALPSCGSLRMLKLQANQIGDEGAKAIAAALPGCGSLQDLCLYSNVIGDEWDKALREAWAAAGKDPGYLSLAAWE